ncbi:MAG: hypothetical protein EBT44_06840 [Actinobacteria bacterium]|uniref:MFS transporter n=1 Tax=Candidatus Fonsibacter lacus TaxID=2576439 RepID=A0A965GFD4_9PROT|nr:hypothetical protein [Candidatus Fonsibacter lacus]
MKPATNNFRAILVMAAIGSYLLWSAGAAIPLLRLDLGISRTLAGAHNIAVGISATLGARLAVPLINKFGRELVMRTMLLTMFLGVIALSRDAAPSMRRMMIQTGTQALVGATAILLISASLHSGHGWRLPIILGAVILTPISLLNIWRVKFLVPDPMLVHSTDAVKKSDHVKIITYGVVNSILEIGIGFWALDLLVSRDAPVALGALGSAILSYGIAVGRLSLALLQPKSRNVIKFAVSAIITGALIICGVGDPIPTMAGLTIAALGVSPLFALGAFRVSESFADADNRISRYMMGTAFSYGFAPFFLAIVFDNFGYVVGYASLIPFAVACLVLWKVNGPKELPVSH